MFFFNEGSKILFRVGLALLKLHESTILNTTDLGVIFTLLRDIPQKGFNCDEIIDCAFNHIGSFPMKRIIKMRRIHSPIVTLELQELEEQRAKTREKRIREQKEQQQREQKEQQKEQLKTNNNNSTKNSEVIGNS